MFKNITLEISLKPFKKTSGEYIRSVCRGVFEQWKPLIKNRSIISIMMCSADGSELLDYTGELDKEFEWCCYALPAMTIHRHDNAMMFSVYSRDTSLETRLKFPPGAPVLNGFSTKLVDGYASYHFGKSVHAECRVFVKQENGTYLYAENVNGNVAICMPG